MKKSIWFRKVIEQQYTLVRNTIVGKFEEDKNYYRLGLFHRIFKKRVWVKQLLHWVML